VQRLVSVQVGLPEVHQRGDQAVHTAFWKTSVQGPVMLRRTNLDGDLQADRRVHGGPDQAVLCYSADHYPGWREELALDLPHGALGENFTIAGQTEWDVCIGDAYEVGDATIQISSPRGPCFKIGFRWDRPELLGRVEATGRHGWYARVLTEGAVESDQELTLQDRPNPAWTVRRAADVFRNRAKNREAARDLAEVAELMARVRAELRRASQPDNH
jgi:MOSC domain-containing protein YiiM